MDQGGVAKVEGCMFASDGSVRGCEMGGVDYRNEYVVFAGAPLAGASG